MKFQALVNAKEILLTPTLRVLHQGDPDPERTPTSEAPHAEPHGDAQGAEDVWRWSSTAGPAPGVHVPESAEFSSENHPYGDHGPYNGEALWFITRSWRAQRLVVPWTPWTIFQHLLISTRALSGFQSWGSCGLVCIRRFARDIIFCCWKLLEERVAGTAQGLADLDAEIVEPQDDVPLPSASTGGPRPLFASSLHLWRGSLVCTPAC